MVELVNQRKKHFAEERERAKRNKPMTQSQLRTYMMNYLKNQGTWKLSLLKNLSFEEVKEEFDKLVKQVESFAPINFEATKKVRKDFGKILQKTQTSKRLKSDEAKDDESTKKIGKRRKQIARKGLHYEKTDKDESEASKDTDPILAMLDKKLQGGKPDEDCYKLLKWMEKQAGIRKINTPGSDENSLKLYDFEFADDEGFGPIRATCSFPGSDPAWSSVLTDIPTPDVTVVEATSPSSLSTLGAVAYVPLSVRSESVVDEDSGTTFSDVSS
ncbi:hypothetical protein Tco_1466034 [Tanacetum coccineum]